MVVRNGWSSGTAAMTKARERGDISRQFQQKLQVTDYLIDRLDLEKELTGHYGCVNCLEWNSDGSILASASDDLHVILWDPFRYKTLHTLPTGHKGNIFSVKFMSPYTLATCAADYTVRVRDIVGSAQDGLEGGSVCSCHHSRVKRLATTPDCPTLLWSAGEDGLVLQHDIRTPHTCHPNTSTILINLLNHLGQYAEAKCLAINPRRPELLAVGANDFYVRLYDRRMIKIQHLVGNPNELVLRNGFRTSRAGQGDLDDNIPRGCVQYFAPGHLATQKPDTSLRKKTTSYLTFSSDGSELLVNLGSEHVYLFNINTHRRPVLLESYIIEHNHSHKTAGTNGFSATATATANGENMKTDEDAKNPTIRNDLSKEYVLPPNIKEMKERANAEFNQSNFSVALDLYNQAIYMCSDCALLYSNRAAVLMRRKWAGDVYAAIRDCYTAIKLDSQNGKCHFRLAKALMDLKKVREANECLLYFKDKFPKYVSAHAVCLLEKDIKVAMSKIEYPEYEDEVPETSFVPISTLERQLRGTSIDYSHRFLGHCNTTTDIKEANFLGQDGRYIVAGSDDGSFFVWSRDTGNIVKCLRGDESIVNCIQVHPTTFLIATSGIEYTVKLWSPRPEQSSGESRERTDIEKVAKANQERMGADPFEAMLFNITYEGQAGASGLGGRSAQEDAFCQAS